MTLTAAEWFEDIDAELAYALKMEGNARAAHEQRATRPATRKPGSKMPARPVMPFLQTVSPTPAANPPSVVSGLGLPGSERLNQISLAPAKPTKQIVPPTKPLVLRERPTKTDIHVSADGTKKYLKKSDSDAMHAVSEYEFLTNRHLALLGDSSENYYPRKLKRLEDEGYIRRHTDTVGYTVWSLLHAGANYCGTQLPPIRRNPFDSEHFERENLNTLMVKLSKGVDEAILYPKTPGYKHEPLAIVQPRYIEESALMVSREDDYIGLRADMINTIINDPSHPCEKAWKSHKEIRKGVPSSEREALANLYKTMNAAHVFTILGKDKKPSIPYSPHFVILRPMVEATVRADGRVEDYSLNHDACRVETVAYDDKSFRQLLLGIYASRMFGRLHEFTDKENISYYLRGAWDSLIASGHLPRSEYPSHHPECWLQVHPLPQPLNNMGKGKDEYDEDGIRRALTKADG